LLSAYYVNDSFTIHDVWTTAPGSDTNDGITPATPKATIQAVIDAYDLEPGDVIRVDTGTYNLTSNITVGAGDSGSAATKVIFQGSPNGAVLDRGSTAHGFRQLRFRAQQRQLRADQRFPDPGGVRGRPAVLGPAM